MSDPVKKGLAETIRLEAPSPFNLFGVDLRQHVLGMELEMWVPILMAVTVGLGIVAVVWIGTRRLDREPGRLQAFLEMIADGLTGFFGGVLGKHAPRYTPLLSAFFLYILLMNYSALIPGFQAATSKLSTTVALALLIFCTTHYEGIRAHGLIGYGKHFLGEPLWLAPLMFPIHMAGELARPLSLSLRLFGNIFGEDTLGAVILSMGAFLFANCYIPVPIQFPLMFLAMLAGLIQAVVFTLLSAVYIGGACGAFEEHGHGEGHEAGHGAHAHEPHSAPVPAPAAAH